MFRYENKNQPLVPLRQFYLRLWRNFLVTLAIVGFSLTLGSTGYHYFAGLPWLDGLLNSAMILTGMGPVDKVETVPGKLFATFYALYSGIAFLTLVAVLMAPVYHRFLHSFHLETEPDEHAHARRPAGRVE